jgi:hypothetical protein
MSWSNPSLAAAVRSGLIGGWTVPGSQSSAGLTPPTCSQPGIIAVASRIRFLDRVAWVRSLTAEALARRNTPASPRARRWSWRWCWLARTARRGRRRGRRRRRFSQAQSGPLRRRVKADAVVADGEARGIEVNHVTVHRWVQRFMPGRGRTPSSGVYQCWETYGSPRVNRAHGGRRPCRGCRAGRPHAVLSSR